MSTIAPLPRRNRLLSSCAVAAIAALTVHAPARAQVAPIPGGFQGTVQPGSSGATVTTPTPTNTLVTVDAPRAIINWTPNDNRVGTNEAIDFLPADRTANFVNNSDRSGQDYIVLNRILPTDQSRVVAFNGAVRSTLSTIASGAQGGQVWFYNPGGILVGATGSFDVGSLLLTANDLNDQAGFLSGQSNSFTFAATDGSRAAVEVQGSITARNNDAYVALIAPRVVQSGNVRVNGSAAYVAAEAATMTITGSLFDIQVTQGSSVGGGTAEDAALVHDGTTTIDNEIGYGTTARHAILVAVPKNDAVTMLVQGNIAYSAAAQAQVIDNRIILSAGHDVNGGFIGNRSAAPVNSSANIVLSNAAGRGTYGADVVGEATGTASATAIARGETGYGGEPLDDLAFQGSLDLTGARGASLEAGAGSRVDVAGSISLDVSGEDASNARASLIARTGSDIDVGVSAILTANQETTIGGADAINGRTAEILVQGGNVDIANVATVQANARGDSGSDSGGDGRAGTATISLTGGSLTVGDVLVQADGRGGNAFAGEGGPAVGGLGAGGTATVEATGGTLTVIGDMDVTARSRGGAGDTLGGNAEGGTAAVRASGTGVVNVGGFASVAADAGDFSFFGGEGGFSNVTGGNSVAGDASVQATSGGALTFGGDLLISATGSAGFGGITGGNGEGGTAGLLAIGGSIGVVGELALSANARGGLASSEGGVRSGDGQGGDTTLGVGSGGSLSAGAISMSSVGTGGIGFPCCTEVLVAEGQDVRPGAGGGGNGAGGTVTVAIAGALTTGQMNLNAEGIGGDGRDANGAMAASGGSDGAGGDVVVEFSADTSIASLSIDVDGIGGEGGSAFGSDGADGAEGGQGLAGAITIRSTAGETVIGSLSISGEGSGGDGGFGAFGGEGGGGIGGAGGLGRGGALTLETSGTGTLRVTAGEYDVSGFGGDGRQGGNASSAGDGDGGDGGNGGEGIGGTIRLNASGSGTLNIVPQDDGYGTTFFPPEFRAEGTGGDGGRGGYGANGGSGGAGGTGRGGGILIDVTGGSLDFTPSVSDPVLTLLRLLAEGYGGDGGEGEEGGDEIDPTGIGGDGGRGGDAFGGTTSISVADGSLRLGGVELFSGAQAGHGGSGGDADEGGDGGRGGNAFGGAAIFSLTGATTFDQISGGLLLQAYGLAGNGGDGGAGVTMGGVSGSGGDGIGGGGMGEEGPIPGGVTINLSADDVAILDITARVKGDGGSGGNGTFGNGSIAAGEGVAAEGGAGGTGTGGTIALTSNQGVNRILSRIKFSANGEGGTGGLSESLAGGAGGKGLGGGIDISATDTGELILAGATLNAYGLGGTGNNGGDNDLGGNGGRGGDATGGAIRLATLQQGRLTLEVGEGGGIVQANAYAFGGNAGSGGDGSEVGDTGGRGGNGGDAAAGRFDIEVDGGTAALGNVNADANARGGSGGGGGGGAGRAAIPDNPDTPENESQPAIPATGAPGGSGGFSTGGTIRIDVADHEGGDAGVLSGGTFNLTASAFDSSGESVFGSAGTVGVFESAAAESGSLELDNLFVEILGFGDANPLGFELVTDTGRIDVLGTVDIFVDTDASFTGIGDGRLEVGGNFNVTSNGGSIALAQDPGAEVFLIGARDIDLSATGSIDGASAGIFASEDVRAEAGDNVGLGVVEAGDDILINGGSATIGLARTNDEGDEDDGDEGQDDEPFSSNLVVETTGTASVAEADVADDIRLTSTEADVVSSINLRSGGEIEIEAATNVTLADAVSDGDIDIFASNMASSTGTLDAGDDLRINADGNINLANALADDLISLSGDDIVLTGQARAFNRISISGETLTLGDLFTENPAFGGEGPSTGIDIFASDTASVRSAESGSTIFADANGFSGGPLKAGDSIFIDAIGGEGGGGGAIDIASAEAGSSVTLLAAGTLDADSLTAGTDIVAAAIGNVAIGSAEAGDDIFVTSANGAVSVASATTTGELDTEFGYGSDAGSNIRITAMNDARLDNGTTPGAIEIRSSVGSVRSAGLLDARALDVNAALDIALNDVVVDESLFLEAENGSVSGGDFDSGGGISLFAGGDIDVAGATSRGDVFAQAQNVSLGDVIAMRSPFGGEGNIIISAGNGAALANGNAAGFIDVSGGSFSGGTLAAGEFIRAQVSSEGGGTGAIAVTSGEAGDFISLLANGDVDAGTLIAGSDIAISGGSIGLDDGTAGRDILLTSAGDTLVGSAIAGDDFSAEAGGTLTGTLIVTTGEGPDGEDNGEDGYGDLTTLASNDGSNVVVSAAGAIEIARIDAADGVTLTSSNGAVLVSEDLKAGEPVDASGTSVTLNAIEALAVGSATATNGNVALVSGGDLQVELADATGEVSASTGGTLGLTGQVNGTQISLASRDIAIGSGAQVGTTQRTTGIQITANGGSAPVVIGGSGSGSGYRLDNAEFARLASRDVTISSQGESASMQIDALTVRGAAASSPNVTGELAFTASGDVEMTGRLAFDTATSANSVRVSAGDSFFADAAGAGIAVTNGTALAGSIEIDARSIVVASQAAADELGSLSNIDDRSDRLGQNDGTADTGGFLRADGIQLSASERIHVQNSGANSDEPNDRAGLSAGAGGITLVTAGGSTPVEIIINGRQANPAGGEFTGEALIDQITIIGAEGGQPSFAARSTVNGCLILGVNCGVAVIPESPLTFAKDVIQELEEEDREEGEDSTQPPRVGFNRLIDIEGSPFVPIIDEPVTGSGNETLATGAFGGPSEEELNRQGNIDDPVTGTGNEQLQTRPAPLIQLPPPRASEQPGDVDGPVTGTGNETLQSTRPRDD